MRYTQLHYYNDVFYKHALNMVFNSSFFEARTDLKTQPNTGIKYKKVKNEGNEDEPSLHSIYIYIPETSPLYNALFFSKFNMSASRGLSNLWYDGGYYKACENMMIKQLGEILQ